ncbi:hypothetical protein CLOBY_08530 [Clostridium saccharobutylicum]|uniref:hypothetical protein n=1 Tax=Clostridium saccharobutylicum TaxID=169679 RepID=UPI000983D6A9|nr:hypothetical protein [Clostridium saccharobutylicum]AQS08743.1 hypothetical protein CLOBY_08530 [Clostridium saccharobutylicum]MBC2438742.1 hypothetical protein [Clostridium saccharobutylicum]NSB91027.1 hypothetical protein [Clostridium saccharobutylicum]NYC28910.1 hypothetical protein [Clostridium saccharobutylicum]OOM18381.1 hypothetical protein CLSAB_07420 [Clostridium saccharobutylicum]
MDKKIDEKILEYLNQEENIKARKDICNGPVKIRDIFYEFIEMEFFDKKLKMYIPKDFEDMLIEARKFKYPSENRPEIIKSNEDGDIAITLKLIDDPLKENNIKKLISTLKLINKRLNPAFIFFDEGILEVYNKKIGFYDFKSFAIDDSLYNLVFLFEFEGKTMMGSFTCCYKDSDEWKDIAFEIIKTIKIREEEKEDDK